MDLVSLFIVGEVPISLPNRRHPSPRERPGGPSVHSYVVDSIRSSSMATASGVVDQGEASFVEHSFRSPSLHASRFVILVAQFVDRRISAEHFSSQFRALERSDSGYLDRDVSTIVRKLSVDVGAYRGDVNLLGVDFIDGEQLWRASGEAFRDLLTLQSELLGREAG